MGFRNRGTMPQHSAKSFICVDSDFILYTNNERNEKVFFPIFAIQVNSK